MKNVLFSFGGKVKIRNLDLSILTIKINCTEANAFVFSQSKLDEFFQLLKIITF